MFDKIFCINLDRRPDRWEDFKEDIKQWGIEAERFPATDGENPITAFNNSCLRVMKEVVKHKKVLVLEDDAYFVRPISSLIDCDLFALGATVSEAKYDGVGYRYLSGWATHAIVYTKQVAQFIIDNFNPDSDVIFDEWLRLNVLPNFKCYVANPLIVFQKPSFSDINGGFVDYVGMMKDGERRIK